MNRATCTEPISEGTISERFSSQQPPVGDAAELHPRICLLGADYENSNLGIRALATGALMAIYTQYPNASVEMLEYGVSPKDFHFDLPIKSARVRMLNIRFSKKLWARNHIARLTASALLLKLVFSCHARRGLASRNPWLQALVQADYVLSLNYGDSFSDIYGLRRLLYVSLPQILALLLGKRLVQLPQTIGPFKWRVCRMVAKWVLSRSALVYTRDEEAVAKIRKMLPASHAGRVRFCHDLGFLVPPKRFIPVDPPLNKVFSHRPVVGFNVSGLLWMGGYTRDNMFGLAADYQTVVRRAIAEFIDTKGATVLLVPHVNASQGEGDPIVSNQIFRELQQAYPGRIFTMQPPYTEREIKHVIARCDFFVGARMHACIAALSQCVPAAAMAYSEKFIGVLRSVGMGSAVVDLRRLSVDQAAALLSSIYDSREALRSLLEPEMHTVKQATRNLLGDCAVQAGA
jgi:colanic acid/amylovoran biosynthesis protein